VIRSELKKQAKAQIKGNIGILFVIAIIMGVICGTGLGSLLIPAMSIGLFSIYLGMTKGEKATVGGVFSRLDLFGRALWLSIITGFFTYLWSLLLIVPGIIKAYSYSMAPYILADNPTLTARQALNESKRITKGYKGKLFVLELSFIPWLLLSSITLGLVFIYVGPYIIATKANFYNAIKAQ
jgi:uncharacterized membrane protein